MNYPTIQNHETLKQTVDARTLWRELGSRKDFSDWIKAKVINNLFFEENIDYILLPQSVEQTGRGGHNRKDFALTIDTAKKVAMAEQTVKGNEARDYFLECERKTQTQPAFDIPKTYAAALNLAAEQAQKIEDDQPKVTYAEAVLGSNNPICVRDWVKTLQTEEGLQWGERKVWRWLEDSGFIFRQNKKPRPYAGKAMDWFTLEPNVVATSKGNKEIFSLKITGLGQVDLGAKLLKAQVGKETVVE